MTPLNRSAITGDADWQVRVVQTLASMHIDVSSADDDLFDGGVLDSMAFVELLMRLEQQFGVTFALADLEIDHFRTVTALARYLAERSGIGTERVVAHPAGRLA